MTSDDKFLHDCESRVIWQTIAFEERVSAG